MATALTQAAAASQGFMSMSPRRLAPRTAVCPLIARAKPLPQSIEHDWTLRWCAANYCFCWLAGAVSVRSLNTLCTCGLGGARLNICAARLMAQSPRLHRVRDFAQPCLSLASCQASACNLQSS